MSNPIEVILSAKATEVLHAAQSVLGNGLTKLFTSKVKADDSVTAATGKVVDKLRVMDITAELCAAPKSKLKEGEVVWFIGHGVSANPDMPAKLARRVISRPLSEMVYDDSAACWKLASDTVETEEGERTVPTVINIVGDQHTRKSVHDSLKALHMYGRSMANPRQYGECFNDYCIDPSTVTEANKNKIKKLKSDASSAIGKYAGQLQDREDDDELMDRQVVEDVLAANDKRASKTLQRIDRSTTKGPDTRTGKQKSGDFIIEGIKAIQADEKPDYSVTDVMAYLRLALAMMSVKDTTLEVQGDSDE